VREVAAAARIDKGERTFNLFFLLKRENGNSKWVVKVKSKKIKNSCYTREVRNMIKETAFFASVVGEKLQPFY
jgi:wobble nucleotide-excising tRNase